MPCFDSITLKTLEATATTSAAYLDACDAGARGVRLDPAYYQACSRILITIFSLVDADECFASLLKNSVAARDIAESIQIGHRIQLSRQGFYPQLATLLNRVSA